MKNYTKTLAVFLLLLTMVGAASAQNNGAASAQNNIWLGGASGVWDFDGNWSLGHIPLASERAVFDITATVTVTGTNVTAPVGVKISSNASDDSKAVIFDGDFNIGNSTTPVNGSIFIETTGKLVVSTTRTLNVATTSGTKPLIDLDGTLEVDGTVYITATTTGQIGIDARHAGSFVKIKNGGRIKTTGGTHGVSTFNSGGYTKAEDFVVDAGGTLEIEGGSHECMKLQNGYSFVNNGTVKTTITTANSSRNYAVRINPGSGSFANNADAVFETIDNTPNSTARSLWIADRNAVTNSGTMNIGGDDYANILIQDAVMTNNAGGYINFKGDQQIRIAHADAEFTNNGYFKKADATSNAIDPNSGTVHNNAFLHTGTGVWPSGGSHTNNGVEVDATGNYIIDAPGSVSFNVGIKVAHNWYDDDAQGSLIGSNDAAGDVALTPTIDCDYKFYSVYGDKVSLTVTNYDFGASCSGNTTMVSTNGTVTLGGVTVGTSPVNFPANQENIYTATPSIGYEFVNWTFDNITMTSISNPLTYMVLSDETITANYNLLTFDITVAASVNGRITLGGVTTNTTPITYNANTANVYTAVPVADYRFVGWTFSDGTSASVDNPLTYTVNEIETITATFELIPVQYNITMIATNGSVTLGGATVGTTLVVTDKDQQNVYTAVPAIHQNFVNWTFSNGTPTSTDNPLTYTAIKEETITANFEAIMHTIIVNGVEGKVTPATGEYSEGVEQTFTATANEGAEFKGWFGDASGTSLTIKVIPTKNMTLTALFEIPLGAENLAKSISKVKVYPIPASSEGFLIDLKSMKGKGLIDVKIFSTQGQLVYDRQLRAGECLFVQPDASWKAGLYLIRVANKEYKEVKRIAIR